MKIVDNKLFLIDVRVIGSLIFVFRVLVFERKLIVPIVL